MTVRRSDAYHCDQGILDTSACVARTRRVFKKECVARANSYRFAAGFKLPATTQAIHPLPCRSRMRLIAPSGETAHHHDRTGWRRVGNVQRRRWWCELARCEAQFSMLEPGSAGLVGVDAHVLHNLKARTGPRGPQPVQTTACASSSGRTVTPLSRIGSPRPSGVECEPDGGTDQHGHLLPSCRTSISPDGATCPAGLTSQSWRNDQQLAAANSSPYLHSPSWA
jgi:hypothetical protein